MKKERKDESFLKKPWYEGGVKALNNAIYSQLRYPKTALDAKLEGMVNLRIEIDYQGYVTQARVISGIGLGCDEEAVRVAKTLKFNVEKSPRKMKVTFHKNINIKFKLPVLSKVTPSPVSPSPVQYMYTIIPTTSTHKKNISPQPDTKVYTYSLKIK